MTRKRNSLSAVDRVAPRACTRQIVSRDTRCEMVRSGSRRDLLCGSRRGGRERRRPPSRRAASSSIAVLIARRRHLRAFATSRGSAGRRPRTSGSNISGSTGSRSRSIRRVDGVMMSVISTKPCMSATSDSTESARLGERGAAGVVVVEALAEARRHGRRSGLERRLDDRIVRAHPVDRDRDVARDVADPGDEAIHGQRAYPGAGEPAQPRRDRVARVMLEVRSTDASSSSVRPARRAVSASGRRRDESRSRPT